MFVSYFARKFWRLILNCKMELLSLLSKKPTYFNAFMYIIIPFQLYAFSESLFQDNLFELFCEISKAKFLDGTHMIHHYSILTLKKQHTLGSQKDLSERRVPTFAKRALLFVHCLYQEKGLYPVQYILCTTAVSSTRGQYSVLTVTLQCG